MNAQAQSLEALLDSPGHGLIGRALGKVSHWRYKLFLRKRHEGVVLDSVGGLPLVVLPGVLNPRLMRTGEFFAAQLGANLLTRNADVLDMGTGSGICAVVAARHARRVAAVDINPEAVRCARINALINRVDIEVLQGDLFAPLGGRQFDVVLFNPPFLRRAPADDADRAWASLDVAERFAAALGEHLKPGGAALVLLSSFGDARTFLEQFRDRGFVLSLVAERAFINERLALFRLTL